MMHAGKMRERVTLAKRLETNPDAPDDYGNTVGEWQDQGEVWAEVIYLRGGEAVIAGRLQGRNSVVFRVRTSPLARQVSSEWKLTNRGVDYAVRTVTPQTDGAGFDLLCESGVAV